MKIMIASYAIGVFCQGYSANAELRGGGYEAIIFNKSKIEYEPDSPNRPVIAVPFRVKAPVTRRPSHRETLCPASPSLQGNGYKGIK
ncbi:MAG: hypothetical protein C4530_20515 [Desulfobacteraceae bacterium]|nr:MAG: hypothetical protein C4530_20515 [Desulfobacteraceae bacterium]